MKWNLGLAGRLGLVLLFVGGVGVAVGSVQSAQYDCVSGTELGIEKVPEANTTERLGDATPFHELKPTEQRIFLEAYTASSEKPRYSDRYANWSGRWFSGTGSDYVEYRNTYWELERLAADCGGSDAVFIRLGGILGVLLGGAVLTGVGIRELWRKK